MCFLARLALSIVTVFLTTTFLYGISLDECLALNKDKLDGNGVQIGGDKTDCRKLVDDLVNKKLPTDLEERFNHASNLREAKNWIGEVDFKGDDHKKWVKLTKTRIKKAIDLLDATLLAERLRGARPITAVLFAPALERSTFRVSSVGVTEDPLSAGEGVIIRDASGGTAGVLIAGEAPFLFLRLPRGQHIPVGAWFGVQMQTGGGSDLNNVDLAIGLSAAFISTPEKIASTRYSFTESARLLFGFVYGREQVLEGGFALGDVVDLGAELPIRNDSILSWAVGLGFRF